MTKKSKQKLKYLKDEKTICKVYFFNIVFLVFLLFIASEQVNVCWERAHNQSLW